MQRREQVRCHRGTTGVLAAFVLSLAAAWFVGAPVAASGSTPTDAVVETVDDTTPPTDDAPTTTGDGVDDGDEDDTDGSVDTEVTAQPAADADADALTWVAVAIALVVLAAAVWWMARRDPDDRGAPPMDDDWPLESDVI